MYRTMREWLAVLSVGAMASLATGAAKADMVVNGGFETGNFAGWSLSGDTDDAYVLSFPVHGGSYAAALSNDGDDGALSQMIGSLVVGQRYQLSYWLYSDGYTPDAFSVSLGSMVDYSQTDIGYQPYTEYLFSFTATSTSADLTFGFQDRAGISLSRRYLDQCRPRTVDGDRRRLRDPAPRGRDRAEP